MKNKRFEGDVCSHTHSFAFDNFLRRLFQRPERIVGEYIQKGDTVVDLGCGPGFFTIDMARMVGSAGRVFAVDLQEEMLEKLEKKSVKQGLEKRIIPHVCPQDEIGLDEKVKADFILAFYMVHETPDQQRFLKEVKTVLKNGGRFLLVEPPFHVSKKKFQQTGAYAEAAGFRILGRPSKKGGRSLLLG